MRWRLAFLLLAVAALATASGGAARPSENLGPHLDDALTEIEYALDHEDNAGGAFVDGGHLADYYGDGQTRDALDHLDQALSDLSDAVAEGELSAAEALHIADHVHEAIQQDEDALDVIEGGGSVGHTLDHVDEAENQKETAGNLIYYGEDFVTAALGCTLNDSPIGGGDFSIGFDGCTKPISKLVIDPGFMPLRIDDAAVGSGGRIVSTFPCTQKLWLISCVPPQPTVPPQSIFVDFGPAPAVITPAEALAFGPGGTAQVAPFSFGSGKATSDLGLTGKIFQVTPRGFQTPPRIAGDWSLGTNLTYGIDVSIANFSTSSATNAKATIDLPIGFKLLGAYPKACKESGSTLTCPLGTIEPTGAESVEFWGSLPSAGKVSYTAAVTSDASEPSPDTNPNSASYSADVYGVPTATMDTLSRAILAGGRGSIFGHAVPGAKVQPKLEQVKKVEVGVLKLTKTAGKCQWLMPSGKFSSSSKHFKTCDRAIWLPAKGTSKWTFTFRKPLAVGDYEVIARATNAAGITASTFSPKTRSTVVLKVR